MKVCYVYYNYFLEEPFLSPISDDESKKESSGEDTEENKSKTMIAQNLVDLKNEVEKNLDVEVKDVKENDIFPNEVEESFKKLTLSQSTEDKGIKEIDNFFSFHDEKEKNIQIQCTSPDNSSPSSSAHFLCQNTFTPVAGLEFLLSSRV